MDLVDLLKHAEAKTLEFKRDLSSPDGAHKTNLAFANSAGGTLLVGVETAPGTFAAPQWRSISRSGSLI